MILASFLKKTGQFILFLGLGVAILYWVFLKQEVSYQAYCAETGIASEDCILWKKLWKDLLAVRWYYVLLIFLAFYLSNYFRALRWLIIFEPLGYKPHKYNAIGTILVSYFANLGLPRSGEFIRAAMISRYEGIPLDKSLGTVAIDRIVDLIAMGLIIVITVLTQIPAFSALYDKHLAEVPLYQKVILPLTGLVALIAIYLARHSIKHLPLIRSLRHRIKGFYEGMSSIKRIKEPRAFLFYTVMIWVWFYVMLFSALKSFEPTAHLSLSAALVVYVFGSLGMLIPTPGGMGSYHYLVILSLAYYNIHPVDAFSFANISFFCAQFANNLLLGVSALIVLYFFNRSRRKAKQSQIPKDSSTFQPYDG